MDYSKKTIKELISLCKNNNIKGYSGKKKEDIISLIQLSSVVNKNQLESNQLESNELKDSPTNIHKKTMGQFYTTNSSYILEGFELPSPSHVRCIIEPFAGKGDINPNSFYSAIELAIELAQKTRS